MKKSVSGAILAAAFLAAPPVMAEEREGEIANASTEAMDAQNEAEMRSAAAVVQRALDAYRAGNQRLWLAQFSDDVLVVVNSMTISGKAQLKAVYGLAFEVDLPDPVILDSGWTGERIFVFQREFYPDGTPFEAYAEYEIRDGKIAAVYANH